MLVGAVETLIGLMLLDTSIKGLKRSVIRRWREGFTITLFSSLVALTHGLSSLILEIPQFINTGFLICILIGTTLAVFRISTMKGVE